MRRVFADTSYWLAIVDLRDGVNRIARRLAPDLARAMVVTSELVFTEVLNAMSGYGARARSGAIQLLRNAQADPRVHIVESSRELWSKSADLYARRADKTWSLTDCASFLIMGELGISEALTSDGDFEQAGFVVLLRDP